MDDCQQITEVTFLNLHPLEDHYAQNNKACQLCCHTRLLQTWYCSYIYVAKQTIELSYWYILQIYYYIVLQYKDTTIFNLNHHEDEYDNKEEWSFFVT